jgi:hypothetical protein
VRTADDDSGPVPHEAFKLPRALLNWGIPSQRGGAGRGERDEPDPDRTPVTRRDPLTGSRAEVRAFADEFDDDPTRAIPLPLLPRSQELPDAPQVLRGRGAVRLDAALARAAQLWRDRPLRTAAIVAGVALITYFAVDGARQRSNSGSQTLLAPTSARPATAPIIVEQLSEARQPRKKAAAPLRGKQTDKPGRRSAGRRARETPFAAVPASNNSGDQAIAPAQSQSRRAERSSTTVSSSAAGLPAWGAEAVREFSGGKNSKAASVTTPSQGLTAKPASSSADVPSPMAADPPSAREQPKPAPVVAAKPIEPPEPVAPPRPSKPLTMDQMLNQVEEAAQAQRKQTGLKAPKTTQRDAELDELINGAMKSRK